MLRETRLLFCALLLCSCASDECLRSIEITPTRLEDFCVGDRVQLRISSSCPVEMLDQLQVSWSSSGPSITVNSNGVVRALSPGLSRVTLTASLPGAQPVSRSVGVGVPACDSFPEGMVLRGPSTIDVGSTAQLTAYLRPSFSPVWAATWLSLEPGVASIDRNGLLTGVELGVATIYVSANGFNEVLHVSVRRPGGPSLALRPEYVWANVRRSGSQTITATQFFQDETRRIVNGDPALEWISSDARIATVANSPDGGVVTAGEMPGTAMISARLGSVTSRPVRVEVEPMPPYNRVEIMPRSQNISVGSEASYMVYARNGMGDELLLDNAMPRIVDPAIASIRMEGTRVVARCLSVGRTTFWVSYGGLSANGILGCV